MMRGPPRSTQSRSSAASDVYKRQVMDFLEQVLGTSQQIDSASGNFENVPGAIWWTINTIATVGYGDVLPKTYIGRVIGSISLILGILVRFLLLALIQFLASFPSSCAYK
eukprot:TRINITY_DN11311_c0_g1_i2.p1 TRINITY_DN11311_c0_g1~~TRINITY_DN11311_c0_g1_i2.p1  ORF type:complete len:110 (-),score=14.90 TRINITY_DN11311_c0_g1_i2:144-473(-)